MLGQETQGTTKLASHLQNVQQLLNSPAKRLLIAYLRSYPYTYDRIDGFARRLSCPIDDIIPAVHELAHAGLLQQLGHGSMTLYSINLQDGWNEVLDEYFQQHPHIPKRLHKIMSTLL